MMSMELRIKGMGRRDARDETDDRRGKEEENSMSCNEESELNWG